MTPITTTTTTGDYTSVTELPGHGATREQLDMLRTRYDLAGRLGEGKDVLEVACGSGPGLGLIAKRARKVVGGDFDPEIVRIARSHYGDRLEIRQLDAQDMPFEDNSFDVVILLEAVYYLPEPEKFVSEARRVLRRGGTLYICSANREWSLFNPSPFSRTYFSADELRQLLERAGFTAEVLAGFPDDRRGLKRRVLGGVRKAAVSLHLIPKTMHGKEKLKRLLYGELAPLPAELTEEIGTVQALTAIDATAPVKSYKVIYAIGRLEDPS
jgi:SAM-dependent methyltransferase